MEKGPSRFAPFQGALGFLVLDRPLSAQAQNAQPALRGG
jgi:hypothetical protein